jgi:3-dehydroquinate synthase
MLVRELENRPLARQKTTPRRTISRFSSFDRARDMVSDIYVERGLVKKIGEYDIIPEKKSDSPHFLLTDSRVNSFYGDVVLNSFQNAGYNIKKIVVPEGEQSKSIDTYNEVADIMFSNRIDKNTILFSLGGGVVNNLAGVLASTLYRGIELMHISTSSMSQVDAALDFKQAINSRMGKNLIGSYYPASKILIDPEVLVTLTSRHLYDGIAESIKHALTQSRDFFEYLKANANDIKNVDVLEEIVRKTISLKVPLLRGDVRDDFNEMLPQYGHSVAHAVEHLSAYELYHGEAVAVGICISAEISRLLGLCDEETVSAHYELCKLYKLPVTVPENIGTEDIVAKIRYDKHYLKGLPHMALPVDVGEMWHHHNIYSVPVEYDILSEAIKINKSKT